MDGGIILTVGSGIFVLYCLWKIGGSSRKKSEETITDISVEYNDKVYSSEKFEGDNFGEINDQVKKFLFINKVTPISVTTTQLHKEYSKPSHYVLILIYKNK